MHVAAMSVGVLLAGCGGTVQPANQTARGAALEKGSLGGVGETSRAASASFGPQYAKPAHCGEIREVDAPNYFIISGIRVTLPPDNALARDGTLVQPGNAPVARYGIGVDDGTGVCAVYMPSPPVPVGGHLSLVAQAVRSSGGGAWFGWVNFPP